MSQFGRKEERSKILGFYSVGLGEPPPCSQEKSGNGSPRHDPAALYTAAR
jgi:hypothetical protein